MSEQKTVGAWVCGNIILRTNHAAKFVYDGKLREGIVECIGETYCLMKIAGADDYHYRSFSLNKIRSVNLIKEY